jgi:hypothetical protein
MSDAAGASLEAWPQSIVALWTELDERTACDLLRRKFAQEGIRRNAE